ncbi:hypothetical protein EJB05_09961, partial [Eragrostis curvula]
MATALVAVLFAPLVVAAFLGGGPQVGGPAASPPPTPANGAPAVGCRPIRRSSDVNVYCVQSGGVTPTCCETLLQAARSGGLVCLCRIATSPYMMTTGYTAPDVIDWYRQCGGRLPMDAFTARHCGIEAPPSKTEKALPGPSETTSLPKNPRTTIDPSDYESKKPSPTSQGDNSNTNTKESGEVDEDHASRKVVIIKVEAKHIVIGVVTVVLVLGIVALAMYVKLAAPGPNRDRAKLVLDLLLPFVPVVVKEAVKEARKEQEEARKEQEASPSG